MGSSGSRLTYTTTVANLQTENLWGWNNANNSIINILY
jgi:hypothetical protein